MNNIMIEKLPSVTFKIRATNEFENDDICFMDGENPWTDVTSDEMFGIITLLTIYNLIDFNHRLI